MDPSAVSPEDPEQIAQAVQVMQIIVGGLTASVVGFAVVAIVVRGDQPPNATPVVAYIGMLLAAVAVPAATFLPQWLAGTAATTSTYSKRVLIGGSIFEGTAFLNLAAYLLEGQLFNLAVAGLLLLGLLMSFPTLGGVKDWIDRGRHKAQAHGAR